MHAFAAASSTSLAKIVREPRFPPPSGGFQLHTSEEGPPRVAATGLLPPYVGVAVPQKCKIPFGRTTSGNMTRVGEVRGAVKHQSLGGGRTPPSYVQNLAKGDQSTQGIPTFQRAV